jgi:hypothetical protein
MEFNRQRVLDNIRQAKTDDLLDRLTAYRAGMEPEALDLIEAELTRRGVDADAIEAHSCQRNFECIQREDGTAAMCSFCHNPAVAEGWGWHWIAPMIWGKRRALVPVFPRYFFYCTEHQPGAPPPD